MKRILLTALWSLLILLAIAFLMALLFGCNLLWEKYVTGWVRHLPWLIPVIQVIWLTWKANAPHKVGCAKCDRGDSQLGHHHECPKGGEPDFRDKTVMEAHFARIRRFNHDDGTFDPEPEEIHPYISNSDPL